jgi:hypothetical protein
MCPQQIGNPRFCYKCVIKNLLKMTFKIKFPTEYQVHNINDDNLDVNIYLPNGEIYFGTLFTIQNIKTLMDNDTRVYFWATNMFIINDLSKGTIRYSISQVLKDENFDQIFSKIGVIGKDLFSYVTSFKEVQDMTGI